MIEVNSILNKTHISDATKATAAVLQATQLQPGDPLVEYICEQKAKKHVRLANNKINNAARKVYKSHKNKNARKNYSAGGQNPTPSASENGVHGNGNGDAETPTMKKSQRRRLRYKKLKTAVEENLPSTVDVTQTQTLTNQAGRGQPGRGSRGCGRVQGRGSQGRVQGPVPSAGRGRNNNRGCRGGGAREGREAGSNGGRNGNGNRQN